jgi:hypothetical protein
MKPTRVRSVIVLLLAMGATCAATVAVVAATHHSRHAITTKFNREKLVWRQHSAATSRTTFFRLGNFSRLRVLAKGGMAATVSGNFTGNPVEIRVKDGGKVFKPGRAHFDPAAGTTSFSFSFVAPGSRVPACHSITVEWRSPTGAAVTFKRGDLILSYRKQRLQGRTFNCDVASAPR